MHAHARRMQDTALCFLSTSADTVILTVVCFQTSSVSSHSSESYSLRLSACGFRSSNDPRRTSYMHCWAIHQNTQRTSWQCMYAVLRGLFNDLKPHARTCSEWLSLL